MTGREYHFHSYDKRYLENVVLEVEDEDTRDVTFSPEELALANGREYYAEYLAKTDKMGADVPNPVSHVAYGYATQLCVLNEDGTIKRWWRPTMWARR